MLPALIPAPVGSDRQFLCLSSPPCSSGGIFVLSLAGFVAKVSVFLPPQPCDEPAAGSGCSEARGAPQSRHEGRAGKQKDFW